MNNTNAFVATKYPKAIVGLMVRTISGTVKVAYVKAVSWNDGSEAVVLTFAPVTAARFSTETAHGLAKMMSASRAFVTSVVNQ